MKGLPEELIYVLVFAAILLFQYLMKRFGPQQQQDPAQHERLPEIPEEAQEIPVPSSVSSLAFGHFGRAGAPGASAPPPTSPPRRRFARRSLMGNRRDMQNAVVIATILGPCRALEPPGSTAGAGTSPGRATQ